MEKIGFLFPGQGSQVVGMGKDLYDRFEFVRRTYQEAKAIVGFDVDDISFNGPAEKLKQTRFTQPALFVHSFILATLLEHRGIVAYAAAGHSVGEFSALAYGRAYSFEEGLKLVNERARLMNEAGKKQPGSMAAVIGLTPEEVMTLCIEAQETGIVQPANYNSPQQIVISGSKEGVEKAAELARKRGARKVVELSVSGAFHSPLMSSAVEDFGKMLDTVNIQMVRIPVYANVTAVTVSNSSEIRSLLHHQLTHSVRWVEIVQNMVKDKITKFIEVGPGKVLSGLVKRICPEVETLQCGTVDELEKF